MAYTLTTKYGSFKYQKPIALTIATTIFLSGLNLLNGNLFYLIIYALFRQENQPICDTPWYIYFLGLVLIAIALFLYYLLIINWRIEVYSKLFYQLQKVTNTYGTAHRIRMETFDEVRLRPLHTASYDAYLEAKTFLDENSATIDEEVDDKFSKILIEIAKLIQNLDYYIKNSNPMQNGWNPQDANDGVQEDYREIISEYKILKSIIRKRERLKL